MNADKKKQAVRTWLKANYSLNAAKRSKLLELGLKPTINLVNAHQKKLKGIAIMQTHLNTCTSLELYIKYASTILCVDSTHGTHQYHFKLITIIVPDDQAINSNCIINIKLRGT